MVVFLQGGLMFLEKCKCFWTMVMEKTLESPLDCMRSNQSILKEIGPEHSLEVKLKLQYFGHLMWRTDSLEKTLIDVGQDWRQEEKGTTEDEMVGWHHQLNGPEFEQVPGVGDGQGSLPCCSLWGCKESDTTERLNWTEKHKMATLLEVVFLIMGAWPIRPCTFQELPFSFPLGYWEACSRAECRQPFGDFPCCWHALQMFGSTGREG